MMYNVLIILAICGSTLAAKNDCMSPLGMQDGSISDEQLKVSSQYSPLMGAMYARLNHNNGYGAWCPNFTIGITEGVEVYREFIQIDLLSLKRIVGISTQGRQMFNGTEFTRKFRVYYTRNEGKLDESNWRPIKDDHQVIKNFSGNDDPNTVWSNMFSPPVIARGVRIYPLLSVSYHVCLRLELYGCDWDQGVVAYETQQGDSRDIYAFVDYAYDGIISSKTLSGGVGILLDGIIGKTNYRIDNGRGWMGWRKVQTPNPVIIFTFDKPRVFQFIEFFCNVRTNRKILLFKSVNVSFSDDGTTFKRLVSFTPEQIDTKLTTGMNTNVTAQLCGNSGQFVKVEFEYEGVWILLGEVQFLSKPLANGTTAPEPTCGSIIVPAEPNNADSEGDVGGRSDGGESNAGMIAGIVCGILIILFIIIAFILWRRNQVPQKRKQHLSQLDRFVHVEFRRQESQNRPPSQIECYAETGPCTTLKGGAHAGCGDANSTPIYASIGENLHKLVKTVPEQKPLLQSSSSNGTLSNGTMLNGSLPYTGNGAMAPLNSTSSTSSNSTPEVYYAEPDTLKRQQSPPLHGYADPVDAITPTRKVSDFFKNPIYAEALYASPYQSASGTSLYSCPTIETQKQETFVEFPRNKLHLKEKIGDGQFGEVHVCEAEGLGLLLGKSKKVNEMMLVAVKMLKKDVSKTTKTDFFKEVKTMARLKHDNVVQLLAVCKDDPMCMIVEYMNNGDLSQFLRGHKFVEEQQNPYENTSKDIQMQTLLYMIVQIAAGMEYISSLKYLHRDLACRNCLVGDAYSVKIGDFGMARHVYCKQYYRIQGRAVLPIRWMAPECIMQGTFTVESDIWAFGVTVWEVLTLAKDYPLALYTDEKVIENVQNIFLGLSESALYPEKPENCPDDIYDMLIRCWTRDPAARPKFEDLHEFFQRKVRLSEGDI